MYPELFKIGPVSVHSYGLMLGIAFLIGSALFSRELKRQKLDENISIAVTFLAIIGGLVGSKLFYIIEEWNFGKGGGFFSYFRSDVLFSPSGLTFYGGLVLAILLIIIYCKTKKLRVMQIFDALSPAAILSYGIARIGCHLSGDGCYGIPVNGTPFEFLGYSYEKGIIPTHPGVLVHPTPLYELGVSVVLFFLLIFLRKKMNYFGQLFYIYLIFAGFERLLVEFIRLNPKVILFLTQAQLISVIMILAGFAALVLNMKRTDNELLKINGSSGNSK
ncbi:MAG: prolipoprotein diacylglyceryl transferase [Ignavibacteria bacterium]|jgi:phosphatidylglycerol:prolipoprotein diacylglycerol transferase|nr:prolipoprotein diacylglyceryl transferase [Ignavibacteria bacterium]